MLDEDGNWTLDLECMLVDLFHWPLSQIDATDIESLFPFVFRYPKWKAGRGSGQSPERKIFADQVEL